MPLDTHPLYVAWLVAFDKMIDAEEAWARAKMVAAPDEAMLRQERDHACDAYRAIADRL